MNGTVMTSSPGRMSSAINAISSASVPLATPMQCFGADVLREALLEFGDLGTHHVLAVLEHLGDPRVDRRLQATVLGLEVDEVHGRAVRAVICVV